MNKTLQLFAATMTAAMMSLSCSQLPATDDKPAPNPETTGPEAVDLGLSVKWASCNVGASSPEEYGDYFAWGETEPKEDYSWETYKWCMGAENTLTKYCYNAGFGYNGFTDNKTVLDPEDDAAAANWGGSWRMPTYDEFIELRDNCTWESITINGVLGRKVTSNKEGFTENWIFLPNSGYRYDSEPPVVGSSSRGEYWSSSLFTGSNLEPGDPRGGHVVTFASSGVVQGGGSYRYCGQSVRPVCD